jgi:hypothetical protein
MDDLFLATDLASLQGPSLIDGVSVPKSHVVAGMLEVPGGGLGIPSGRIAARFQDFKSCFVVLFVC